MNVRRLFATTIVLSVFAPVCFTTLTTSVIAGKTATPRKGKININTATRQQLVTLPGIDRSLSFKIVMHRRHHRFTKIEDILEVEGVHRQLYAKIRPFVVVEGKAMLQLANR